MNTIKEQIMSYIEQSKDLSFLRREFSQLGSYSGVGRALQALVKEGKLAKFGYGVYLPAKDGEPTVDWDSAAVVTLEKLGAEPEFGGRAWREWMEGRTLQVPAVPTIAVRKRMSRKIGLDNLVYRYEYWKG